METKTMHEIPDNIEGIAKLIARRDNDDYEDVKERLQEWSDNAIEAIESGEAGLLELEDSFADEFGLEPDYLDALVISRL
jgi:uncharacterized protein Yka (UPF0111/DUF47 family)